MFIDVPDEVRNTAVVFRARDWLESLPSIVESLADTWSLVIGEPLRGGHAALVVEATLVDGSSAVLKIAVPGQRTQLALEATFLGLVAGESCAQLLQKDLAQDALLLERLGPTMFDVVPDPKERHDLLCELAVAVWRPVEDSADLPTGADLARQYGSEIKRLWHELGRPCSRAVIDDAVACAGRRARAFNPATAVLVHGDIHDANALQAPDGTFKLIDPSGVRAEPACDLGTIVRCNPDSDDDLQARTERLANRTGVDATAIWEWGTLHRVIGGLHSVRVGFQPFGDLLLTSAENLVEQS